MSSSFQEMKQIYPQINAPILYVLLNTGSTRHLSVIVQVYLALTPPCYCVCLSAFACACVCVYVCVCVCTVAF